MWLFVLTNFMFLVQRWCIEKKLGCELFQWLSRWFTNRWIQTPGEKKSSHVLIYKGEEKYSTQVIIMQHSISTVFIWLDILTITEIKHQSNRYIILQLIQIYNITAYTITDTVNIQQQSVSDTHCPQSVLYRGTGIKDRIVHAITVNKEWWVNNQAAI